MSAAIAAARKMGLHADQRRSAGGGTKETRIVILEAGSRPGRKICRTGNGRCNLTNRRQSRDCYRSGDGLLPERFYQDGWDDEVRTFMGTLGILTHERMQGYVYPRTDQAVSVAEALVKEAQKDGINIKCGARVISCEKREKEDGFLLLAETGTERGTEQLTAERVILASGGLAAPEFCCRGDGYRLAESLGHEIVRPVPALCALTTDETQIRLASGVRVFARVTLRSGSVVLGQSEGELQITERGISGIPVFQISRYASAASSSSECLYAVIDFLPELAQDVWERECERRIRSAAWPDTLGDFCRGLVPDRIAVWLLAGRNLVREKKIGNLSSDASARRQMLQSVLDDMRGRSLRITGTDGFERAQVTAGGIALSEVTENMESGLAEGLFLAGEVLDVDGICGGSNLTWAIHSGLTAGRAAARSLQYGVD